MKLFQTVLLVLVLPLLAICFVQAQQTTTALDGNAQDASFMAARITQLKAQLEAVERETLRRLNCQIKTQVSTSTGCQEIPGLRGYIASMITPSSYTIRRRCSVDGNVQQWFDLAIPGGASSTPGNSSPNRFVYGGGRYVSGEESITRDAAPTGALCYGAANRTRLTRPTSTSLRIECEDGADGDFNDLVCNIVWGPGDDVNANLALPASNPCGNNPFCGMDRGNQSIR